MTHQRLHVFAISACCLILIPSARADEQGPVFESEIQPVLADKCGKCHSDKVQKGGLDLSRWRSMSWRMLPQRMA